MSKWSVFQVMICLMLSLPLPAQDPPGGRQRIRPAEEGPPPIFLTEDQEAAAEDFLKEEDTELYEDLQRLKNNNRKQWRRLISNVWRRREHLLELKANYPERYAQMINERKLENLSKALAKEYSKADSEQKRESIRKQLLENLNQIFDYRQASRLAEIEKLEKRLSELKKANQDREKNKEFIVQRRLDELIGTPDEFAW